MPIRRLDLLSLFAAACLLVPVALRGQDLASAVEIQGSGRATEQFETSFAALVLDRPIRDDEESYSPIALDVGGSPLTAAWTSPLDLYWDFGDGSAAVNTGDRVSVSHVYEDDGTYTVTLTVRDRQGVFATATHEIEIVNRNPFSEEIAAVEIDPDTSTVELTATAQDAHSDTLTFHWDFGDGDTAVGEDLWWSRHQYLVSGTYEVVLTITDEDGGEKVEKKRVRVYGAATRPGSERDELDDPSTSDVVATGLEVSVDGVVAADLVAEVRHFRGLYLQRIKSGACRFVFTAWDDANLANIHAVIDLFGVPPEGAKYTISNPVVALVFEPTAEAYRYAKKSAMGRLGGIGMGGIAEQAATAQPGYDDLTESQKKDIGDKAGIEIRARQPGDPVPMPAISPLGIDERYSFGTSGGELELVFIPADRATGDFSLTLKMSESGPVPNATVSFEGSFALDLVAARRDGIVRYGGCEPPPFEVESTWPEDETENLYPERPKVSVELSDRFDPDTFDTDTFEVGYTNPDGDIVPAAGRILRDEKHAFFVPDEPLLPGVRYTARVRTGDEGVRSRGGSTLEDTEGDGWYSWRFTTRVDMVPESDGKQLLACHLYQGARDVPLIPGKPAIARVFANWEKQPGVHPDHQVKELETRIVLRGAGNREVSSQWHKFVRPDLWAERRIDERSARHTAQVTGIVPEEWMDGLLMAFLEVRRAPGEEMWGMYRTRCPIKLWDQTPTLSIDFVALRIGEWAEYPAVFEAALPVLQSIADASVDYAWQLFPFAEVEGGAVRELEIGFTSCRCPSRPPDGGGAEGGGPTPDRPFFPRSGCTPAECRGAWGAIRVDLPGGEDPDAWLNPQDGAGSILNGQGGWQGLNDLLRSSSSADVIVAFGPHRIFVGGATGSRLPSGRGVVLALASLEDQYVSRYVEGLVHEVGHVLELDHLPFIADGGDAVANRRNVVELRDGSPPLQYEGIEGLRMSRSGQAWWNKSSQEGNQQEDRLAPLMFPGTIPTDAAFIANHHYRAIQILLESLP